MVGILNFGRKIGTEGIASERNSAGCFQFPRTKKALW